jgi:DNA replication and repair protein RecF
MLKITKVVLDDFLNIEHCDLDVDSKVVLITGPNGSGKSSILEAIRTILSSKKRSDKYAEYIRQGKTRATIHLEADVNGKPTTFDVEMNLKRGAAFGMTIQQDGREYKNNEAVDLLRSFDFDYYSDIVLTMQGDQDITELSPTARSVYLQRLLNFDFERQKTKIRADLDALTVQNYEFDRQASTKNALIERERAGVRPEIDPKRYDVSTDEAELTVLREKLRVSDEERTKTVGLSTEKADLSVKKAELDRLVINLDRRIDEIKRYEKETEETSIALENTKTKLRESTTTILEKEKRLREIGEDHLTLLGEMESLESFYQTCYRMSAEGNHVKMLMEDGVCPHCGQETTGHAEGVIEGLMDQLRDLSTHDLYVQIKTPPGLSDLESFLTKVVENGERASGEVMSIRSKIKILTAENQNVKVVVETEKNRRAEYEAKIDRLSKKVDPAVDLLSIDKMGLVKDKREKMAQSQRYEQRIRAIDDEISKMTADDHEGLGSAVKALESTISAKVDLKRGAQAIILENARIEAEVDRLGDEVDEITVQKGLIQRDRESKDEALRIFDKDLPNFMIVKTCASLQNEMNDFIHAIFPLYDVKLIQSKGGTIFNYTKDRTIDPNASNSWINAKMSSGFEKAMLTMAFKQSLCKLYDLDFCVLDECDKAADDDSSDKLFEQILGDETWSQCWVITHKKSTCQSIIDNQDDCKMFSANGGKISEVDSPFED